MVVAERQTVDSAERAIGAFQFRLLATVPGLRHGVTRRDDERLGGNLSFTRGPDAAAVLAARRRWAERIGLAADDLVVARQVHGATVERVGQAARGRGALSAEGLPEADGLATNEPGLALLTMVADCVPILLVDPRRRVLAAVHAGWRGTVADIAGQAVRQVCAWYGSRARDLLVGVGPSIGPCCYAVGAEVAAPAAARFGADVLRPGPAPDNPYLDLWTANQLALTAAGVPPDQIEVAGECTRCRNDLYFSHRAEGPTRGLFGAMIGWV